MLLYEFKNLLNMPKNDLIIGFYKSIDIQITKLTRYKSDYQNDIINYIRNSNKAQYKALENKLLR